MDDDNSDDLLRFEVLLLGESSSDMGRSGFFTAAAAAGAETIFLQAAVSGK